MISTLIACGMVAAAVAIYWGALGLYDEGRCNAIVPIGGALALTICLYVLVLTANQML